MKNVVIALLLIQALAFGETPIDERDGSIKRQIPIEYMLGNDEPNPNKLPQCLVVNKNPDAWLYATGGAVLATVVWGFFFYKKNR